MLTTFESQAGLATEVPKKQPARAARLQQRELLFACLLFHTATVGAELRLNEAPASTFCHGAMRTTPAASRYLSSQEREEYQHGQASCSFATPSFATQWAQSGPTHRALHRVKTPKGDPCQPSHRFVAIQTSSSNTPMNRECRRYGPRGRPFVCKSAEFKTVSTFCGGAPSSPQT